MGVLINFDSTFCGVNGSSTKIYLDKVKTESFFIGELFPVEFFKLGLFFSFPHLFFVVL